MLQNRSPNRPLTHTTLAPRDPSHRTSSPHMPLVPRASLMPLLATLLISSLAACTQTSDGCSGPATQKASTRKLAIQDAEAFVLDIAENLVRSNPAILETAIDWQKLYENAQTRRELPNGATPTSFRPQFITGLTALFKPGPRRNVGDLVMHTRARKFDNGIIRVFLYDGAPDEAGQINLTFLVEADGERPRIIYVDFYTYARWAMLSKGDQRIAYRKQILGDYE